MPDAAGTVVLVELGLDFHRDLFLFSREDRLLIAAAVLTAALQEYPKAVRAEAFEGACNRASSAVAAAKAAQEGDELC